MHNCSGKHLKKRSCNMTNSFDNHLNIQEFLSLGFSCCPQDGHHVWVTQQIMLFPPQGIWWLWMSTMILFSQLSPMDSLLHPWVKMLLSPDQVVWDKMTVQSSCANMLQITSFSLEFFKFKGKVTAP
jgi:hypothetical protein